MSGDLPPLPQYAPIAWCSVKKAQGQLYLLPFLTTSFLTAKNSHSVGRYHGTVQFEQVTMDQNGFMFMSTTSHLPEYCINTEGNVSG